MKVTQSPHGANRVRRTTALLLLASFTNLVACTEYTPVRGPVDAATQPDVRVTLTDQGQLDVASRIGLRARQLEGTLQTMTDSSLSLSVRKVTREGGIEDNYTGEQLSLSRRDVDAVEKTKTSVVRSLLAAGAILASVFLIAKGAGDVSGGKTSGPPPPTN
jgi:hypothetical protein